VASVAPKAAREEKASNTVLHPTNSTATSENLTAVILTVPQYYGHPSRRRRNLPRHWSVYWHRLNEVYPMEKPRAEWLIVGLGNPGPEYAETRHNIGWRVVCALAERYGGHWHRGKGPWMEALLSIAGHPVLTLLPLTYMNRSGEAVRGAQQLTAIPTDHIVIVLDELNFPLGRIHLKASGSAGGHNGMASVIECLGTGDIPRLRCGIGRNFPRGQMTEYVLSPFAPEEIAERDAMVRRAVSALEYLVQYGLQKAMSTINAGTVPMEGTQEPFQRA